MHYVIEKEIRHSDIGSQAGKQGSIRRQCVWMLKPQQLLEYRQRLPAHCFASHQSFSRAYLWMHNVVGYCLHSAYRLQFPLKIGWKMICATRQVGMTSELTDQA